MTFCPQKVEELCAKKRTIVSGLSLLYAVVNNYAIDYSLQHLRFQRKQYTFHIGRHMMTEKGLKILNNLWD